MGHGPRGITPRAQRLDIPAARSCPLAAYRWGEDGLLGISDENGRLCFAIALWNERDQILKERLSACRPEGNHGEDVKEVYVYLDGRDRELSPRALPYPQSGVSLR